MVFKKKNKIIESKGDRVLHAFTTLFLILILIVVGYPVLYVVSCSFSSDLAISTGRVFFLPVEPTLAGYEFVFKFEKIWVGYRNTIFYTVIGTSITMILNIITAYPLSRPNYQGRGGLMMYFFLTTMFGAGLIPTYMVKSALGMVDTIWAVVLAGALGVSNVIILRTAFRSSIPGELFDAAAIDGANDFQSLVQIALPLVKATTSVLVLYSAVGCWNEYFNSMIYLRSENLYPLQLFLRNILTTAQSINPTAVGSDMAAAAAEGIEQIQYALIVVATVPVLVFYFVVQKYFKKGVMIGSVKG